MTKITKSTFNRLYVYGLTVNAALGYGFMAYNYSIFNSLQDYLQRFVFPDATTSTISLIASSVSAGAIVGALISGKLVSHFGRRKTMMGADIVGIISSGITLIAHIGAMVAGRFLSGVVGGINTVAVAMYLVEMSPLSACGATGSLSIITLELMAFASLVVGYAMPQDIGTGIQTQMWRILLGAPAFLNLLRLLLLIFVYKNDTPYYDIEKKLDDNAKETLKSIFTEEVNSEFSRIKKDVVSASQAKPIGFRDLFNKKYRKGFGISLLVAVLQQYCGCAIILVFSNDILMRSTPDAVLYSTILAVINLAAVMASFGFVERLGRRPLLMFGTTMMGVNLLVFGLIAIISGQDNPVLKYLIITWPILFQASSGSLTFLYVTEMLPAVGVASCISANWAAAFVIGQSFLPIVEVAGLGAPFIFFGALCFVAALVFSRVLIETKDKTKSQIIHEYSRIAIVELEGNNEVEENIDSAEKKDEKKKVLKPASVELAIAEK